MEPALQHDSLGKTQFSNGVIKMEYLFVVLALATAGLAFAGLKGMAGSGKNKNITRLQLD
jgi:hypothetical protein